MIAEKNSPLVSVIIPCYNHAHYLGDAISSVLSQTYKNIEVFVIDDGSDDKTNEVAAKYDVTYIRQSNCGLSAARNTGTKNSRGKFLVFLDADDVLLPEALVTNLEVFRGNPEFAFVAGGYRLVKKNLSPLHNPGVPDCLDDPYKLLLNGNFIGMHATVMYDRAKLVEAGGFNTNLSACEDYEVYLKLASKYPVCAHQKKLALYRIHNENMSRRHLMMLQSAIKVLSDHKKLVIKNSELSLAYKKGVNGWTNYYFSNYFEKSTEMDLRDELKYLTPIFKSNPVILKKYTIKKMKALLKSFVPANTKRWLYNKGYLKNNNPEVGKVNLGDLKRKTPLSRQFGYDRGGPIDRYYIEGFLKKNADLIKGNVLEIGDNDYTAMFGKDNISKSDVLHIHEGNPIATIIGDLSDAPHIPDNSFDCFILTQTLHLIYDFHAALRTCYRILKPGGTLLLSVPGISQIDHGEWESSWFWSFTARSMKLAMEKTFPQSDIAIETFGNVLTSTAFLYGMGVNEIRKEDLDFHDPSYQQIITVKATKR